MRLLLLLLVLITSLGGGACRRAQPAGYEPTTDQISQAVDEMNELMLHDVTNPPLAARFFAYVLHQARQRKL